MEQSRFQRFSGGPPQADSGYSDSNVRDTRNGAFDRLPLQAYDSSGAFGSAPAIPGGFWPGQSVFQQPPPPSVNSQRFNYAHTEWSTVPPPIGHDRGGYRPPFPQMHSFNRGPQNPTVPDFDPTRPPPPLYETQPKLFPHTFDDRKGPAAHTSSRPPLDYIQGDGSVNPWQSGSDTRPQSRLEAPHFHRSFDEHRSYPNSGPPLNLPGFQDLGSADLHCQRQRNTGNSTDHQTHNEPWQQHDHQRGQDRSHSKKFQPLMSDVEIKRRQVDEQWLASFLLNRKTAKSTTSKRPNDNPSVSQVRETLYSAARLVSELSIACQRLRENVENENVWAESYPKAIAMKRDVQEKLKLFSDPAYLDSVKKKLSFIRKKRLRNRIKKREWVEEKEEEDARAAEREAAIDKWRMKRIQQVEEKKKELELKMAADSVLCEVRKKQADAKRMLDVLRSLEKLRKLRKEAAGRKGIFPEKEADEVFEGHVDRLRKLIQKRTGIYASEEKALRVMLEGEQEEERKRELEKRQKKEREKFLQKKRETEAMLFGETMHPDHPLQPFRQCYTQAEHSLHALIQIRREWDSYLVPVDHPDGSSVPQSWVLPEPPSDETWASALEK